MRRVAAFGIVAGFLAVLLISDVHAIEAQFRGQVAEFVQAIKTKNRNTISEHIAYPLQRVLPIPSIKSRDEFITRFDEVFDEGLIKTIIHSNLEKDWDAVGWRGIMLNNGQLWLDYDGMVIAVNHLTDSERVIRFHLIEKQRSVLYKSVRKFAAPVLEWNTKKYRIRIDDLGDSKFRYASWAGNKRTSEKPDLVLFNGKREFEGSGGNHFFTFLKGEYKYVCCVWVLREEATPPGELKVYKKDDLLLSDPVVEVLVGQ
jgi:hypothetical protein